METIQLIDIADKAEEELFIQVVLLEMAVEEHNTVETVEDFLEYFLIHLQTLEVQDMVTDISQHHTDQFQDQMH